MIRCKNALVVCSLYVHVVAALGQGPLQAPFYMGPYPNKEFMRDYLAATKSLEDTIACRPTLYTSNYTHHDHSTSYHSVNSWRDGSMITMHTTHAASPENLGNFKTSLDTNNSWWQRTKNYLSPFKGSSLSSAVRTCKLSYKAMLLSYAYVNYRLFRLSHYLQAHDRWFLWRQEIPLAHLIALPQNDIARELAADIRQRYGTLEVGKDALGGANPFGIFMQEIEEEVAALNNYQRLSNILLKVDEVEHKCLSMCCNYMPKALGFSTSYIVAKIASKIRVKNLFYLNDPLLQQVSERLSRLAYIKTVFVSWMAEHKILTARDILQKTILKLRQKGV